MRQLSLIKFYWHIPPYIEELTCAYAPLNAAIKRICSVCAVASSLNKSSDKVTHQQSVSVEGVCWSVFQDESEFHKLQSQGG